MKTYLFAAVGAAALAIASAPAAAQHTHMPGMHMPAAKAPAKKKPATKKKAAPKKQAAAKKPPVKWAAPAKGSSKRQSKKHSAKHMPAKLVPSQEAAHEGHREMAPEVAAEAAAQQAPAATDHGADHSQHDIAEPSQVDARSAEEFHPHDMSSHGESAQPNAAHDMSAHAGAGHEMATHSGALGSYPMQREASGTSWQPDTSEHMGLMSQAGDWTLMGHGVLNLVYDHQSGRRGDDKLFASGMLMGMARRPLGNGTVQFKAMVSPDPLMGKSGYPLLLASGETANGTDRLIDRQHPHDFFMELSASVSQKLGGNSSVFVYGGLPGEPAFGPPAFMHREAIMDSPEAPISHHWLDSTHISFGVLTAGLVLDRFKVEVSRFNGREPDQHRWNIETGPLDSTAIRLSWNPTRELSLQGSWGHFKDPEQLEPGVDQKRLSASALYAREIAPGWKFAGTLAWGRKSVEHHGSWLNDDAYVAEASLKNGGWTIFGRGEITENRELLEGEEHGEAYRVGKISLGALRDFRISEHLSFGAGGLFAVNFVPDGLRPLYGSSNPTGGMLFARLKLN